MAPLHKQDLFEARTSGYHNYRIPGLAVTPGGAVLACCEARQGHGGDWDPIDILMRRSLDSGQTWEPARVIVDHRQFDQGGIHNFVFIADPPTGTLHALFGRNYAHCYAMHSTDDGATFSEPVEITGVFEAFRSDYDWKVIAAGPGHGIQLANGRLVVPVWLSTGEGGGGHRPSAMSVITSDDHGQTWQRGAMVAYTDERLRYPSETVAVELNDGRVLLNIRSESDPHRRLISISPDGAQNWSEPAFDDALLEPQCMASIVRLYQAPQPPQPILFANPDNLEQTLPGLWSNAYDRKRLTVKLSRDDCRTWPVSKVLEDGPSAYSDLIEAPDGAVLCFYECGMMAAMADTRALTLARFDVGWLES
ncbi:MAG: glycoside hydrolase [Anaerolineae bacterium]|nr:glycoside hydrolase [Anaerolineae bacterium]